MLQSLTNNTFGSKLKKAGPDCFLSRMQLFDKNNAYAFVSSILFIGCTVFVVYRGYLCFDKFLKKPENSKVSFESTKNQPFPSFTLCASQNVSYNDNQMKECQLDRSKYLDGSQWVGKGGINCTNPKLLHKQVAANSEDLDVEVIGFFTYAAPNNTHTFQPSNWNDLDWKIGHHYTANLRRCFTFSVPDNIVQEGIRNVFIKSKVFDTLYLHKEGTLSAPIPGSSLRTKYADLYQASVTHESIELLHYDGKNCKNDDKYNYDKCKQDYIYKVI